MLEKQRAVTTSFPGFSPTCPYGAIHGARERRVGERTWERGWEQLLRRSIIILEENCGDVDDIYLLMLRF